MPRENGAFLMRGIIPCEAAKQIPSRQADWRQLIKERKNVSMVRDI